MMSVLFNAVYERAKQTDKRVCFLTGESHYQMDYTMSLKLLDMAVRHNQHYNLPLDSIKQTGGEFPLTPKARTIANPCLMMLIHSVNVETEIWPAWTQRA